MAGASGGSVAGRALSFLRYLRNGAFYGAVRRPPTALELQQPCVEWDVSRLPFGVAAQHAEMRGLWLVRRCMGAEQIARIRDFFYAVDSSGRFRWHCYEPGRLMMPLHASPALDAETTRRVIQGIEVFGAPGSPGDDPVGGWPRLAELLAEDAAGARELMALQRVPQEAFGDFAGQPCLFLQGQALERGAEVTPHRDALPYGGDMIATLVVEGANEVRVGPARFRVEPGDLYGLAGEARYDVEHEVKGASQDRFSVTIRYGLDFRDALPPLPGSCKEATMHTSDLFS